MLITELLEYLNLNNMKIEGRKVKEISLERIRNEVLDITLLKRKVMGEYKLNELPCGSYVCFVYRIDEEGKIREKRVRYERNEKVILDESL